MSVSPPSCACVHRRTNAAAALWPPARTHAQILSFADLSSSIVRSFILFLFPPRVCGVIAVFQTSRRLQQPKCGEGAPTEQTCAEKGKESQAQASEGGWQKPDGRTDPDIFRTGPMLGAERRRTAAATEVVAETAGRPAGRPTDCMA